MEITKSSIEDLLNNLVKPMFDVKDTNEFEDKVSREVRLTLRYFNIHNSIVDFYTISDI